jgi:hypothetical protein
MFPASYTEINVVVGRLFSEAHSLLGDQIIGEYLHGSLAYRESPSAPG